MKFFSKSYSLYTKDTHHIWCRSAKFLWKSKFCSGSESGSGSWFYIGFQYQTYISYIEDTHQILFGSAYSFESYCVHSKSPHTTRQTDRRKFFCSFCFLRHTKHEHSSKGENFFISLLRLQYFHFLHTPYVMRNQKRQRWWRQIRARNFARFSTRFLPIYFRSVTTFFRLKYTDSLTFLFSHWHVLFFKMHLISLSSVKITKLNFRDYEYSLADAEQQVWETNAVISISVEGTAKTATPSITPITFDIFAT